MPAGRYVVQACKRFIRDFEAAQRDEGAWRFEWAAAERPMQFAQLMPNIKGPMAGKPLVLMRWQRWIMAALFGFVDAHGARRFRQAFVAVPRGNGKSAWAAAIALYLTFVEGEGGAEGYAAAVTRDQARIVFETAQHMARRSDEFRSRYGVTVAVPAIYQTRSASSLRAVSSDAKSLDGLNVHFAVCDEIGSHKTSEVYDVLLTALGKRRHPMLLSITTATGNSSGVGKRLWDYSAQILSGNVTDDRLFAALWSIDDGDDIWDETIWAKANPGWGVTVQPDAIGAIARQARQNAAQEAAFKTRHLNVWVGADEGVFSVSAWADCTDTAQALDDYEGKPCFIAVDLSSKVDLTGLAINFVDDDADGKRTYRVFTRVYLPDAAVMEARNASYPNWAAEGHLIVTPGDEIDFTVIEQEILELCRRFDVRAVGYDPWAATQLSQRLREQGVPMLEYRARTQNFSEPTKELEAAMRAGRIAHDGNGPLAWCIGNVVGHYDARGNVYPRKARAENKIDAAIALIMTIGLAMQDQKPMVVDSIYNDPKAMAEVFG